MFQEHLELLDIALEVFGVSSVVETFEIVLDYFRSIWNVFGQFKEHIEGSGMI